MPGTYNSSAHQTCAGLGRVQKKEKQAAASELFVHTWAGARPCIFRLPRTLESSQRNMHSTVLDLGRSLSLRVLNGDCNPISTDVEAPHFI